MVKQEKRSNDMDEELVTVFKMFAEAPAEEGDSWEITAASLQRRFE